jgi:hypothetical protein
MYSDRSQSKGHFICNAQTFHCDKPMYLLLYLDVKEEKLRQESGKKMTGARGGEQAFVRAALVTLSQTTCMSHCDLVATLNFLGILHGYRNRQGRLGYLSRGN